MFNYRFDVIFSHKKFTWTDFGRVYIYIYPRRYTPLVVVCTHCTGCTTEFRQKVGPLLTATGPHGHVQRWIIDLERKAVRSCVYSNDALFHEYVVPIDKDAPLWSFTQKISTVGL